MGEEYKTWKNAYSAATNSNNSTNANSNNSNNFNWAQWGNNNVVMANNNHSDSEEEEESEWEQRITFSVERARSGRSTCRGCWTRIEHQTLRFGAHSMADPEHGVYYDSTHWYHPTCFGDKFKNDAGAQQRQNIRNNAGLSARALDNKLTEIFHAANDSSSSSDDSSSSSEDDNVAITTQRVFVVDGINYRARVNRLENLTVYQLKKYCTRNSIYIPSSMRKAALCAMIRRDITQHLNNR